MTLHRISLQDDVNKDVMVVKSHGGAASDSQAVIKITYLFRWDVRIRLSCNQNCFLLPVWLDVEALMPAV